MLPPGGRQLTASNVVVCVVRNPNSVGSLCPSVAAGGKEECGTSGRNEDRSEMHVERKLCWMGVGWDVCVIVRVSECLSVCVWRDSFS